MKFMCKLCGWIYDESAEDRPFRDLDEDWVCPACGAPKSDFEPLED